LQSRQLSDAAPAVVKVVERGKKPHREVRWRPAAGLQERLDLRVDTESATRLADLRLQAKQIPRSMRFGLTVAANEGSTDGARVFAFVIDRADLVEASGLMPKLRQAREDAAATLRGSEGHYVVDPHGQVQEIAMNLPPDPSIEVWSVAGDLAWALRQLVASFPEDPIGLGARWTMDRRIVQDGIKANEVSTREITDLEGQLVIVNTHLQQKASPQTFRSPGSSIDLELAELDARGTGKLAWDLTRLIPRSAQVTLTETRKIRYYNSDRQPVTATAITRRSLTIPE